MSPTQSRSAAHTLTLYSGPMHNNAQVYDTIVPAYWLGLRWGAFTCVGWQVTLCDPMWQVMSRRSMMGWSH